MHHQIGGIFQIGLRGVGSARGAVLTFLFPPPGYDDILRERLVGPVIGTFRFR